MKGAGDPVAGEFPPLPLPNVKDGAAEGNPAPKEKDVVGAPAGTTGWCTSESEGSGWCWGWRSRCSK